MSFSNVLPGGGVTSITNQLVNFGYEYVWHCHILSHEENDMMRPVSFIVNTVIPTAPTGLTGSATGGNHLSWTDPTPTTSTTTMGNLANEVGFQIQRATGTTGGTFAVIAKVPANTTTYIDATAVNRTAYRYIVNGYNNKGTSPNSNTVTITTNTTVALPAVPALALPATGAIIPGNTVIPLTWGAVTGATSYDLQVLSGAIVVVNMPGLIAPSINLPNGLLAPGVYTWQVGSTGPAGNSAYSAANSFTISPLAPGVPVLVSPISGSGVSPSVINTLTWGAVTGAVTYGVKVTASGAPTPLINVTGLTTTSYNIPASTLAAGTTYSWTVNATNTGGSSAFAPAFTLTTVSSAATGLLHVQTTPAVQTTISLNGAACDDWGLTYVKLAPGSYTLSFSDVNGFQKPTSVSVSQNGAPAVAQPLTTPITIVAGQTTDVVANFTQLGNMHIITSPALPVTIAVNGVTLENWGLWTSFPAGSYTVTFGNITGYTTPAPQTVTVTAGATTTVTGTYLVNAAYIAPSSTNGLLLVQTSPAVRSTISLNGNVCDDWGLTFVELAPGSYTLSLSDVFGFKTPTSVSVSQGGGTPVVQSLTTPITITTGVTTSVVANFAAKGNLHGLTTPAVPATIYVNGLAMDDWGFWTEVDPGTYTVSFEVLAGYATPPPIVVTVTGGVTTQVTGNYGTGISSSP
jgi:hypothetical protein